MRLGSWVRFWLSGICGSKARGSKPPRASDSLMRVGLPDSLAFFTISALFNGELGPGMLVP